MQADRRQKNGEGSGRTRRCSKTANPGTSDDLNTAHEQEVEQAGAQRQVVNAAPIGSREANRRGNSAWSWRTTSIFREPEADKGPKPNVTAEGWTLPISKKIHK